MKNSIVYAALAVGALSALSACSSTEAPVDDTTAAVTADATRPNVLLIVADDLGFSDLGAFGGEIETPNLDALATAGVRFTSFYTAPTCSPTRSMLMTGKDSHSVGMGAMAEALPTFKLLQNRVGYEGYLNPETTTIAEKFAAANYRTVMTGKWHLGLKPEHQPSAHGFELSFALSQGGGDHYGVGQNGSAAMQPISFTENGQPATYPVGVYSSDFFATQMIEYLSPQEGDERPFFAYLAFTAPHWPLQAPKDIIAKYEGKYDAGPAAIRAARLQRMRAKGLLDDATLDAKLVELADWTGLSPEQRAASSHNMEIYAAMIDSLDQNVGRVLDHLRETGEFDNTVIVFMSDNGAEGIELRALMGRTSNSTLPEHKSTVMAAMNAGNADPEKAGTSDSFLTYGDQWSQAGMAPFREDKSSTEEGGIRAAAFVSGPGVKGDRIFDGPLSVRDIMPTTLDMAGISHDVAAPKVLEGGINAQVEKSWVQMLSGETDEVRTENDAMAWELHLKRAVRLGDWKAVYLIEKGKKPAWRLYNLESDAGESLDVSGDHPDVVKRVNTVWDAYAEENGVVTVGGSKPPH